MIEFILLAVISVLCIVVFLLFTSLRVREKQLQELAFSKQSQSVKYGKLTEQFIPFTREFPFSPSNFRFIGSPVDGIAFEDDKIVLCEFKTASGLLSEKQKHIRKLVAEKKVEWFQGTVK